MMEQTCFAALRAFSEATEGDMALLPERAAQ
jgi:hypothetical protein